MSQRVIAMPAGRCNLGFARIDITPPAGIYHRSWGAAKHDASTGVHRELTASALVFADPGSGEEHALVALELGWLQAGDLQRLLGYRFRRNRPAGRTGRHHLSPIPTPRAITIRTAWSTRAAR